MATRKCLPSGSRRTSWSSLPSMHMTRYLCSVGLKDIIRKFRRRLVKGNAVTHGKFFGLELFLAVTSGKRTFIGALSSFSIWLRFTTKEDHSSSRFFTLRWMAPCHRITHEERPIEDLFLHPSADGSVILKRPIQSSAPHRWQVFETSGSPPLFTGGGPRVPQITV